MDWNRQNQGFNWNPGPNQVNQSMNDSGPKPIIMNTLPVVNNNKNQNSNPQCIPGRVIHDVSEIAPNEVPMDNTYSTFIRDDYKEIYMKTWSPDGSKIDTLRFVLAEDQPQKQIQVDNTQIILDRIDQLEKKLNVMNNKRYSKPKPQQKGGENNA